MGNPGHKLTILLFVAVNIHSLRAALSIGGSKLITITAALVTQSLGWRLHLSVPSSQRHLSQTHRRHDAVASCGRFITSWT